MQSRRAGVCRLKFRSCKPRKIPALCSPCIGPGQTSSIGPFLAAFWATRASVKGQALKMPMLRTPGRQICCGQLQAYRPRPRAASCSHQRSEWPGLWRIGGGEAQEICQKPEKTIFTTATATQRTSTRGPGLRITFAQGPCPSLRGSYAMLCLPGARQQGSPANHQPPEAAVCGR